MREDILNDVLPQLVSRFQFKRNGPWLQQGKCPECGRKELYAAATAPWVIRCGRLNKCGYEASVQDLFPDSFCRFNERFPSTTEAPTATADAYMSHSRALDTMKCRGWYRQGLFRHPRGHRPTATVVFDISREHGIFMERLIEPVRITNDDGTTEVRKANFVGRHKGLWWAPPGMTVAPGDNLYLVEGCIDAIQLHQKGRKAVATLSAGNYPGEALKALTTKDVTLVWALDNDNAGRQAILRHVERAREDGFTKNKAALIPQKRRRKVDWNDAGKADLLTDDDFARYHFHGDLLLAPNPMAKALLIWTRHQSSAFAVEFGSKTYWWEMSPESYAVALKQMKENPDSRNRLDLTQEQEAALIASSVKEIANCRFEFLYFQQNTMTDESWYYTRIKFPVGHHEILNTFNGAQISTASEFKKRLLSIAPGALFAGSTNQLNWLVRHHLDNIKIVDTVPFVGYSREHEAWIFPEVAVSKGQRIDLNDEDFFEIGRTSIKTLNRSVEIHVGTAADYKAGWIDDLYTAFDARGLVALAWFFGSLFAEQIRREMKSFPFLEIAGQANAGKTTLIEFLWKLVGRAEYEGFDPNKATLSARTRNMTQVANLPVCFLESDREDTAKQKQFDWDELKTAYNGRASRSTGVRNGGNDTNEPPFRGSVLISQNMPVDASEAIMTRIVHLFYDTSHHTPEGGAAADRLSREAVENLSHFLVMATTAEKQVMETFLRHAPACIAKIQDRPEVRHSRIAKCHGQLMALTLALAELIKLPQPWVTEVMALIETMAVSRKRAIAKDHPIVEEFWDLVDYLGEDVLNHSRTREIIAINLNHLQRLAAQNNQPLPPLLDLKRHLKGSISKKFLTIKTINSGIKTTEFEGKSVKCWTFAREGGSR